MKTPNISRYPALWFIRRGVGAAVLSVSLAAAHADVVTFTQQTGYDAATFTDGTAGAFNNGGTEIGMYANSSGNKQVVVWRNLRTDGTNGGSARDLQVGDLFTITVSSTSAYGNVGFSLNDGGTQGSSYANRISGSRLYIQEDGTTGSWYTNSTAGNTTLNYNVSSTRRDYTFKIYMTSETTANVQMAVNGTDVSSRLFNIALNGSAGTNIDAFSMWLQDDYNGVNSQNIYWKQTTSVENKGYVELGYFMTSGTFDPGLVKDGLAASSTSTASANAVNIGGDAGSAVLMNENNTYTGATTVNANATARLSHSNGFGTTAGGVTVSSGGALEISNGISVGSEALSLSGTGVSTAGALRNTSGNNSWGGTITLAGTSRIVSDAGELTVSGGIDFGNTSGRTLTIAGAGNVTLNGNLTNVLDGSQQLVKSDAGILTLGGTNSGKLMFNLGGGTISISSAENLGNATGVSSYPDKFNFTGSATLRATETMSLGSTGATNHFGFKVANGATATFDVAATKTLTIDGQITPVSGTGNIAKAGSGTMVLTADNSFTGTTTVGNGTLQLANSAAQSLGSTSSVVVSSGGTLLLSQSNQINNSATMSLGGGTVKFASAVSEGTTSAVGLGALTLSADSTIDFNSFAGSIDFSSFTPSTFTLAVTNWVTGSHLVFNADQTSNLSHFTLNGLSATQTSLGSGFYEIGLSAVPEPGTIAAGLSLLGFVAWRERRRLRTLRFKN